MVKGGIRTDEWAELPETQPGVRNFRSVIHRLLMIVSPSPKGARVEIMTLTAGKPDDDKVEGVRLMLGDLAWKEIGFEDPSRRAFVVLGQRGPTRRVEVSNPESKHLGRDKRGEFVSILSKFRSKCRACGKQNEIGDRITWSPSNGGAVCERCWEHRGPACWLMSDRKDRSRGGIASSALRAIPNRLRRDGPARSPTR